MKEPVQFGFEHLQHCHNIVTVDDAIEYDPMIAGVAVQYIHSVNEVLMMNGHKFGQQYIIQKGLKKFGKKGRHATSPAAIAQALRCECWDPRVRLKKRKCERQRAKEQAAGFLPPLPTARSAHY